MIQPTPSPVGFNDPTYTLPGGIQWSNLHPPPVGFNDPTYNLRGGIQWSNLQSPR